MRGLGPVDYESADNRSEVGAQPAAAAGFYECVLSD